MKKTSTYILGEKEEVLCLVNEGKNTKYKRNKNGDYIVFSKESVVDRISTLINKKMITKGEKIDNKQDKYISYVFNYTVEKEDKKEKHVYRIKVDKDHIEENKVYINRLNALVKGTTAIRTVNHIGFAILLTGGFILVGSGVYALFFAEDDSYEPPKNRFEQFEDNTFTHQDFIDKMHEQGITDEEMQSWGMEIEEQEETKPFHQ